MKQPDKIEIWHVFNVWGVYVGVDRYLKYKILSQKFDDDIKKGTYDKYYKGYILEADFNDCGTYYDKDNIPFFKKPQVIGYEFNAPNRDKCFGCRGTLSECKKAVDEYINYLALVQLEKQQEVGL